MDHNGGSHWGMLFEGCVLGRVRCSRRSITASWGEEFGPSGGLEWEEEGPIVGLPGDRGYVWEILHTEISGGGGARRLDRFALLGGGTPYPRDIVFGEAWFEGTLLGMEGYCTNTEPEHPELEYCPLRGGAYHPPKNDEP